MFIICERPTLFHLREGDKTDSVSPQRAAPTLPRLLRHALEQPKKVFPYFYFSRSPWSRMRRQQNNLQNVKKLKYCATLYYIHKFASGIKYWIRETVQYYERISLKLIWLTALWFTRRNISNNVYPKHCRKSRYIF